MDTPTGIEAQVCEDIATRQQMGIKKYGRTVEDSTDDMLQHAYEEALDLAIYLKAELERKAADDALFGHIIREYREEKEKAKADLAAIKLCPFCKRETAVLESSGDCLPGQVKAESFCGHCSTRFQTTYYKNGCCTAYMPLDPQLTENQTNETNNSHIHPLPKQL